MKNLKYVLSLYFFIASAVSSMAQEYHVYVSSYTKDQDAGISIYRFSEKSGELQYTGQTKAVRSSSYLCLHPSGKYLYSVAFGEIAAFSIDKKTGGITLINKQKTGKGPCYVSVDHTGQWAFVANYPDGFIEVFPIGQNGALGAEHQRILHKGSSVNKSRQEAPHPHMIMAGPQNKYVIVPDLGADKIFIYRFDAGTGKLRPNAPDGVKANPGAGPRHFAFHPNGQYGYVLNELNSTVTAYAWSEKNGILTPMETYRLLPDNFTGFNKSADIHLTPSGKFLYASNRGHNSITAFRVRENGRLEIINRFSTKGDFPRNFYITQGGKYLLVENKHSGNIVIFRSDPNTGRLEYENEVTGLEAPQCLKMLNFK